MRSKGRLGPATDGGKRAWKRLEEFGLPIYVEADR
jgi:hypothetical protein